jgi:hypothetical protein
MGGKKSSANHYSRRWSSDFLLREGWRNKEMDEKQVYTMATAEKIAPGGDWDVSLWIANAKLRIQENGGVHVVSEGAS